MLIVSVHLPKTAGASFLALLEANYGQRIRKDYSDFPIHKSDFDRNLLSISAACDSFKENFEGVDCIHGHFLPIKYLPLRDRFPTSFVTWMRNPVDRIISHYAYWLHTFDAHKSANLHKKIVSEGWSLRKFCLSEEMRNIYTKFLWAFPITYFDFIGIFEFYESDRIDFENRYLNTLSPSLHLNAGPAQSEIQALDAEFRREVEEFHKDDMQLYQRALDMREQRLR